MNKLEKRKTIVIVVGILLLVLVIVIGGIILFKPKEEDNMDDTSVNDDTLVNEVSTDVAEGMYQKLVDACNGAFVWDIEVGQKLDINTLNQDNCKKENYYSKMNGYSYNTVGVTIYVNVLKQENNKLYKLDNTYIAEYDETTLSDALDSGTTYIYTYRKQNDGHELTSVELMEVVTFE